MNDTFATVFDSSQADARAIVRGVRPLSRAEESAFYGEPLTATAIELGEEEVTSNMELVAEFLNECSGEREPSAYFGPISTPEMVGQILLNKRASDEQLAAAAKELRARLLEHHKTAVLREAARSME